MLRSFFRFWRTLFGALILGLVVLVSWGQANAETRHALVLGNDSYQNLPSLLKARNDAMAVDEALRSSGFTTTLVLDAEQTPFLEAFAGFAQTVNPGDVALFYYAGHGIEIDGQNYLLPTDAPDAGPGQELVLTSRAISVASLLETLTRRGARASIFILDACRDNPFQGRTTRGIGGTRGLAPVSADGTFILYSAGSGQAALDRLSESDDNPNSVFTRALVPLLTTPGLTIREITNSVRSDVRRLAKSVGYDQFPAYYDEMEGDLEFVAAAADPVPAPDPCDAARLDLPAVRDAGDGDALAAYIDAYSMCPVQSALATALLQSLELKTAAAGAAAERPDEDAAQPGAAADPEPEARPTADLEADPLLQPAPDVLSPEALAKATQTELKRVGCYDGAIDGIWGKASQRALDGFTRHSAQQIDASGPTAALLAALYGSLARICPLECGPKYLVVNETCQLRSCSAGLVLASDGSCVAARKPATKTRPSTGNCFSFEGQNVCE